MGLLLVVVRRVGGAKGRREAMSPPGPGLVVVDGRTSEGRPRRVEEWVEVEDSSVNTNLSL